MVESLTTRWLLALGLATLCFGLSLVVLHVPIRTIGIFFALGIPLILLWLYVSDKSRRQIQQQKNGRTISDLGGNNNYHLDLQQCICSICSHDEAEVCLNQKCACCTIMKDNRIVGHSVNPLQ
jgi:hypothetical protein